MPFVPGEHDAPAAVQLREACHEMQQPVAGMLALTAAALAEPALPRSVRNRLEQIAQQAEWLGELVRQMRGDAKAADMAAEETDLVNAANAMAAAERLTSPGVITVAWAEPVRAGVHPVVVRRLLTNLLSNAVRAAGPGGTVTIEIGRRNGWATIVVSDSGPGFGRIQEGCGLGLPAMSRIIARCGGRIECGSAPGGGLRFTVLLPCRDRDSANGTRIAGDAGRADSASLVWVSPSASGARGAKIDRKHVTAAG